MRMNRLLVFALVASVANASGAFADESIPHLGGSSRSGTRGHVGMASSAVPAPTPLAARASVPPASPAAPAYQAEAGTLSKSGMGKGRKMLIYIGLAAGFAASVWTIDHKVLDVTPSSLGTRQD